MWRVEVLHYVVLVCLVTVPYGYKAVLYVLPVLIASAKSRAKNSLAHCLVMSFIDFVLIVILLFFCEILKIAAYIYASHVCA